ncbi:unnamed protein product [Rotaria socialis]|uniref:Uncharacterized protein n=1 Tax=Rotaria socialis TaxID=392032 RepID=A0A821T6Z2_9BILA|nr:unnamed protein product [Rotaria socialis]
MSFSCNNSKFAITCFYVAISLQQLSFGKPSRKIMTEAALSSLRSPSSSSIPSTSVTLPASSTPTSKDSLSSTTMVQTKSSVGISNSFCV